MKALIKKFFTDMVIENGKVGRTALAFIISFLTFIIMLWISFFTGRQVPTQLMPFVLGLATASIGVKFAGVARTYADKNTGPQKPADFQNGPMG